MSLEKTWGELNNGEDNDLLSLISSSKMPQLSSNSPLKKIKKNLLFNIIWCIAICLVYVFIILYFKIWQVQIAIGVVLMFTLWALYTAVIQFKKLNTTRSSQGALLNELQKHHASILSWMNTQQRVAIFIYPISAAGGFMLGGFLGSGKPVEVFMSRPDFLIALLIITIVLVPACYYLAKWLCNQSFGKHLKTLGENINALKEQ